MIQSRTPDYLMSSEATQLQERIGAKNALSFSITDLGCVGISCAISLAKSILESDKSKNNILITFGSKPLTKNRFRYPVTITGDGGIGVIVSRQEYNKILDIKVESNGCYWDLYNVDYKDKVYEEWQVKCKSLNMYSFELSIESRNRFTQMNESILQKFNLEYKDINHYIMQNLSASAFGFYENIFGIEFYEGCMENLEKYGHLGSIDIVLNLYHGIKTNKFKRGDKVLVMNNSPVASWSSMLIQI